LERNSPRSARNGEKRKEGRTNCAHNNKNKRNVCDVCEVCDVCDVCDVRIGVACVVCLACVACEKVSVMASRAHRFSEKEDEEIISLLENVPDFASRIRNSAAMTLLWSKIFDKFKAWWTQEHPQKVCPSREQIRKRYSQLKRKASMSQTKFMAGRKTSGKGNMNHALFVSYQFKVFVI